MEQQSTEEEKRFDVDCESDKRIEQINNKNKIIHFTDDVRGIFVFFRL